ncbi:MAG: 6-phosphogluconolactonase [Mangrovibacterium sp.]
MRREVKVFSTKQETAEALVDQLERLVRTADALVHIALSGGETPALLFDVLAAKEEFPWQKVHFWWGDERCVLPNDEQSNYRLAKERLLDKIEVSASNVHRIKGELDPQAACEAYEQELKLYFNSELPMFDLILLGLGEDGHTASIFPHELHLFHEDALCVVATHPTSGQHRVSFSGKLINAAQKVAFLAIGANKAMRVAELLSSKEYLQMPAWYVHPKRRLMFYLDAAAMGN